MRKTIRTLLGSLLVFGAAAAQAAEPIDNQYIVMLKADKLVAPVAQTVQSLVAGIGGAEVLQVYNKTPGFAVRVPAFVANILRANPLVKYVEQDQVMELVDTQVNPPSYGLDRVDQRNLPLSASYNYPPTPGAGVHVYIIDTGLRTTHVDFAGRVGTGRNFATNGTGVLCTLLNLGCPAPQPTNVTDCNGHGTHVSGTSVGASYGIAKSATLHPVRVFGCGNSTATSTIIAGVDWVTANRQLPAAANMSLGGGASQALDDSVTAMINSGVTVAIAAGNDSGADACAGSPARVAAGIVVASSNASDARSSFSNIGTCVDLFAPGENIISAGISNDTSSATLSGTSMASPHVAGAIARYLELNPGANAAQVQSALIAGATAGVISNPGAGTPNRLLYLDPAGP